MSITYHKSVSDAGGAIGVEIFSDGVNDLIPDVSLNNQESGIVIERKFYIANSSASDVLLHTLSLEYIKHFSAVLFESSGDAQVVGDLTGSEVDESPIQVLIPASGHKSFWLRMTVSAVSTVTDSFNLIDTKQII